MVEEGYGVVVYHRSMLGEAYWVHWGGGLMIIYESMMIGSMGHCTVISGDIGKIIYGILQ